MSSQCKGCKNCLGGVGVSSEILQRIFENPKPVRQKPLKLFLKIAQNVLANPGEAKFRRLNAMKIVPKLSACDGSVDLLEATGFKGDGESHYVLPEDDDLKLLRASVAQVEAWEAAALELARKQARAIMQANMAESGLAAKAAYREDLRRNMAIQKKEKDQDYRPVVSSKKTSHEFGAAVNKLVIDNTPKRG